MEIHLSKPGGAREGPYTLEQINTGLAQRKFRDTDYWAWYEGLDSWVPLHAVPGVIEPSQGGAEQKRSEMDAASAAAPEEDTHMVFNRAAAKASQEAAAAEVKSALASGMPVDALEQIFIFTDGEGPAAMQSPVTTTMLQQITGTDWETIRNKAPRDVFGRCSIPQQLAAEGRVPASAWRAVSALKPELAQGARDGAYRICIRSFETEAGQKIAAFLFYKK